MQIDSNNAFMFGLLTHLNAISMRELYFVVCIIIKQEFHLVPRN